jgi:hypothetical protein
MFKVGQKVKSITYNNFEGETPYGIVVEIEDTPEHIYAYKYHIQSALATSPRARILRRGDSLTDATNDPDFPTGQEVQSILEKLKPTGGRRKHRKTKKARRTRRSRRNTRRN